MTYNELKKRLKKNGCRFLRDGANHEIWYSPVTDKQFPIGRHGAEEVRRGTLQAIRKQSGIDFE